jgi:DNA mismatch repair ATPase MutS
LEGRTFELGMRNIFTGPNASGKSVFLLRSS